MKNKITPCQISSEIVNTLAAIAGCIGQLEGVNLIRPDPQLRRKNRIRTIQASLAIEGNSLTRDQVTALLEKKRVIGPPQDILEVQNAIMAYNRLTYFKPLSMDSLLEAHGIMMKGLAADPGSLRKGPIGVMRENTIFHEAPHWKKVGSMMWALFNYLNESDDHLLIKSSRFHFQLEHIHPFIDGNGRIGRLWQTRLLMLYHPVFEFLPIEHLIREHQREYYGVLANGDDTGDCTDFVAFILAQTENSLKELVEETRGVTLTVENRLEIARNAFGENTFSRKEYQNLLKTISTATASRDLHQGVKLGYLKRSGDKRTTVYRFAIE
ncbi:MAG: Fic family protein [Desulfobacterales bacterium]|jgi:Fic family protein